MVFSLFLTQNALVFSCNMGGTLLAVDLLNVHPCMLATAETRNLKALVREISSSETNRSVYAHGLYFQVCV